MSTSLKPSLLFNVSLDALLIVILMFIKNASVSWTKSRYLSSNVSEHVNSRMLAVWTLKYRPRKYIPNHYSMSLFPVQAGQNCLRCNILNSAGVYGKRQ